MEKKKKKSERPLAKTTAYWLDEEVSKEDLKAAGKFIAKWNPVSLPFTLFYYYIAWVVKHIHKAGMNFIDRDVKWYWKVSLIVLLLLKVIYIVVPVDLIPDFVPYVGYLDDLAAVKVFLLAVRTFNWLADKSIGEVDKADFLPEKT